MNNTAIQLTAVTKRYRTGQRQFSLLKDALHSITLRSLGKQPYSPNLISALNNISLTIHKGERVAIIGPNGSGKSTLLKVITGVTSPNSGTVQVNGRIGALLEVTVGFHPELTGRENVYLNGVLQGLSRQQISECYDAIVSFSELDNLNSQNWLDTPVKWYSSGMYVRLGFAVTAHLNPDLLIIDEALSVGDIAFQEKCLAHMTQLANSGVTLIYVTQSMESARSLCDRGVVLSSGRVMYDSVMAQVIPYYEDMLRIQDKRKVLI